jgi:hypothetical protein
LKQLFICCMFLVPSLLQGQVTVYNSSLRDTTKSQLYCGLENDIVINGINDKDYTIKLSSGALDKRTGNIYRITRNCQDQPTQRNDTLLIYKKGKLFLTHVFLGKIFCWDSFYIQFGSRRDSLLSVQEIIASPMLRYKYEKCNYKNPNPLGIVISSFFLQIESQQSSEIQYSRQVYGNTLLPDDVKEIKKLQSGDKVILSQVRIIGSIVCSVEYDGQLVFEIK